MINAEGPKLIEYNARFGDPEAEVIFPLMDEDLAPLLARHGIARTILHLADWFTEG